MTMRLLRGWASLSLAWLLLSCGDDSAMDEPQREAGRDGPYGDCLMQSGMCSAEAEGCMIWENDEGRNHFVCLPHCETATDCPSIAGATPGCYSEYFTYCFAYCGEEGECPAGMVCRGDGLKICMWPEI